MRTDHFLPSLEIMMALLLDVATRQTSFILRDNLSNDGVNAEHLNLGNYLVYDLTLRRRFKITFESYFLKNNLYSAHLLLQQ